MSGYNFETEKYKKYPLYNLFYDAQNLFRPWLWSRSVSNANSQVNYKNSNISIFSWICLQPIPYSHFQRIFWIFLLFLLFLLMLNHLIMAWVSDVGLEHKNMIDRDRLVGWGIILGFKFDGLVDHEGRVSFHG